MSSEAGGQSVGALLGLGVGAIANNQVKQNAKGQANDAKALADKQIQAQQLALETARLQLEAQKSVGSNQKSNTGLYIGLGVGGVVVLGLVVYLAVKK
jgi:CHASE1-domain containing sensor protein